MNNNYFCLMVKRGDTTVRVESSDRDYVQIQFDALCEKASIFGRPLKQLSAPIDDTRDKAVPVDDSTDKASAIVEAIHNNSHFSEIESKVLNKKDRTGKILMCFYFAEKIFAEPFLTTGDVERITDRFHAKILTRNVTASIKANLKRFLIAEGSRKPGAATPYKINRLGIAEFEKLLGL